MTPRTAPATVTVTVRYSKPGTQPPIYLAGSFDSPQWHEPREMRYTTDEHNEHDFYTDVDVQEGREYQYKFRVGPGDWWVLNEDSPTGVYKTDKPPPAASDDQGFRNNLLAVPIAEHNTSTSSVESMPAASIPTVEETAPAVEMDHPNEHPAEEAMDTRETSDVLFSDEITKGSEGGAVSLPVTPGLFEPAEPHPTPASGSEKTKEEMFKDFRDGKRGALPLATLTSGAAEPHPTPAAGVDRPKAELFADFKGWRAAASPLDGEPVEPHSMPADGREETGFATVEESQDAKGTEDKEAAEDFPGSIEPVPVPTSAITLNDDRTGPLTAPSSAVEKPGSEHVREKGAADGPSAPLLVVEKVDSEPSFGDDFGPGASVAQKDAFKLRAEDAEPDLAIIRSGAHTPELADVAAEVADSAAVLDRDAPTPPIPDEEAGRIGYRRMSHTPIPEVAATAAEVADVAAVIDGPPVAKEEPVADVAAFINGNPVTMKELGDLLEARGHFAIMNDESIQFPDTPPNEKVPLFPHEGGEAPEPSKTRRRKSTNPTTRRTSEPAVYDPNDPTIKKFPEDREGILRELALMQARLPPDTHDCVGGVDSDIAEEIHCPGKPISPMARPERSPSLDSIAEENDEEQESDPQSVPANVSRGLAHLQAEDADGEPEESIKPEEAKGLPQATLLNGESAKPERVDAAEEAPIASALDVGESPPSGHHGERALEDSLDGAETMPLPVARQQIPATPFVVGNRQLGHHDEEVQVVTGSPGPRILVEPATPGTFALEDPLAKPAGKAVAEAATEVDGNSETNASGVANTTAFEDENGTGNKLRSRKQNPSTVAERPLTPNSLRSAGKDAHSRNFLKAFWRVVFVDWIGGLIMRLCGGRDRRT
ncbi:hypothetical protein JHW43_003690 [Diplocarpon mali]|nr:hypothetical protein JHW43_003690 [Diplocarpon mali]